MYPIIMASSKTFTASDILFQHDVNKTVYCNICHNTDDPYSKYPYSKYNSIFRNNNNRQQHIPPLLNKVCCCCPDNKQSLKDTYTIKPNVPILKLNYHYKQQITRSAFVVNRRLSISNSTYSSINIPDTIIEDETEGETTRRQLHK